MNAAVLAAGAAAFTSTTSTALGAMIVHHFAGKLTRLERLLFSFLIGSSFLSLLVFFLTAVHLAYTAAFVLTGFAITAVFVWKLRLRPESNSANCPLPVGWLVLAVCLTAPFAALYLGHALSPESSADGVGYHLGLVARYLREHRFPTITTDFFASFPEGMEMLYLFGFSIGRHSAAALIHLAFLFVGGGLLVAYGIRFNHGSAGIGAAILFLLAPDVGITASSAYVDVGEASVCFGLFFALQIWKREGDDRMLALAGVLAGFAAAIKYSGFIAPVYAVVTVFIHLRKQPKRFRYCLTLIVIPAALLIAPWLIKNVIEVGNPVSPFANRWFPNSYVHISFEDGIMARWRHWNGVTWKEIPMEVTIHGGRLQGIIGPAFLLAPIILLLFRDPLERQVLVALLWFLAPYFGNIGTRFLILPLPFLALGICIALARSRFVLIALLIAHFLASQPYFLRRYSQVEPIAAYWDEALRRRPEEETLRARVEGFAMAQYINRNLPNSSRIYDIGDVPLAYTNRNVDGYFQSAVGERLYYVFFSGVDAFPQWAPTLRTTFNFHAERLNRLRIERAPNTGPIWAVSEIRFFDNAREVVPNGSWRLHSSNFQWDIGFAFDNNLATSWHAWDRPRQGMFIEVEFGKPVELTGVQLYAPLDQRGTLLGAEGENGEGRTETLSTAARFENVPLPANYRLQIGRAIKAEGYTHLILRQDIPGAEVLRGDPAAWGMRFIVEIDGLTLYQFE